ncbi:MAG: hypothetical protein L0H70_05625 [Xanthomonadales bacterium]|nr:hypothetical protein [Xanthomonadales bacterium]
MSLPLNAHTNSYVFGRGKIYIDIFDTAGAKTGERYLGNCPGFTLNVATEKYEHFASTAGLRKKDLTVITSVNFNAKISCDDVGADNLALFVGGDVSSVSQAATPVTAEAIKVKAGCEYQLGATASNPMGVKNVTTVTVKDDTDATTYVLNTDYTVDTATARISIIAGGAITDGDTVHAGYTPTAGSRTRVTSGASGSNAGAVRFIADNAVGENRDCYIASASLAASGDLPFITENDVAKFDLDVGVNEKDSNTPQIIIDGTLVAA